MGRGRERGKKEGDEGKEREKRGKSAAGGWAVPLVPPHGRQGQVHLASARRRIFAQSHREEKKVSVNGHRGVPHCSEVSLELALGPVAPAAALPPALGAAAAPLPALCSGDRDQGEQHPHTSPGAGSQAVGACDQTLTISAQFQLPSVVCKHRSAQAALPICLALRSWPDRQHLGTV